MTEELREDIRPRHLPYAKVERDGIVRRFYRFSSGYGATTVEHPEHHTFEIYPCVYHSEHDTLGMMLFEEVEYVLTQAQINARLEGLANRGAD